MLVLSSADFSKFVFMKTFRVSNSWIQFKLFTKAISLQDKQHDTHSASKIKKKSTFQNIIICFWSLLRFTTRFNNFSVMSGRVLSSRVVLVNKTVLIGKRELIALLNLSSWCLVMVERLFLAVPRGCLQLVIVVFPDHTHLLFPTHLAYIANG